MHSWTEKHEGMGYQNFSVAPFVGLNDETRTRIIQLKEDLIVVNGLSVLDIGIFAGLSAICCFELGAKSVFGADVDIRYFNEMSNWANDNKKQLSLVQSDFSQLDEGVSSDVVLLLEVYHWLSHQGLEACTVAHKLNLLAKKYIYIETPWDITDPSVKRYSETASNYNPSRLLECLIKLGWSVNYLGLCSYFPVEYHRARFMATRVS